MCEPVTIATAIGVGAGLAGTVVKGIGDSNEAGYQQNLSLLNAGLADQASSDAKARGEMDAAKYEVKGTQIIGAQRAAAGASGVDANSGSVAQLGIDTRELATLDAVTTRNNAAREAWGFDVKATQARAEADMYDRRQKNAVLNTVLGGLGQVASGVGSVYSAGKK